MYPIYLVLYHPHLQHLHTKSIHTQQRHDHPNHARAHLTRTLKERPTLCKEIIIKERGTWYADPAAPNKKPSGKLLRFSKAALHVATECFELVAPLLVTAQPRTSRRPKRKVLWSSIINLYLISYSS